MSNIYDAMLAVGQGVKAASERVKAYFEAINQVPEVARTVELIRTTIDRCMPTGAVVDVLSTDLFGMLLLVMVYYRPIDTPEPEMKERLQLARADLEKEGFIMTRNVGQLSTVIPQVPTEGGVMLRLFVHKAPRG